MNKHSDLLGATDKGALMCTSHFPDITSWLHYHTKHCLWTKKSLPCVAYCTTCTGKSRFGSALFVITIWLYSTSGVLKDCIVAWPARGTWSESNKQCICRAEILALMLYNILYISIVREGADKSLARPTSRYRRTESIVSLERGACSCADLQAFLVTEAERKHVRRRAGFQQHRDASCHQVFFSCNARRRRKFTPFWQKH